MKINKESNFSEGIECCSDRLNVITTDGFAKESDLKERHSDSPFISLDMPKDLCCHKRFAQSSNCQPYAQAVIGTSLSVNS